MYKVVVVGQVSNRKAKHLASRPKRTVCGRIGTLEKVENEESREWCRNCAAILDRRENKKHIDLTPVFYWCPMCEEYALTNDECEHGYSGIW